MISYSSRAISSACVELIMFSFDGCCQIYFELSICNITELDWIILRSVSCILHSLVVKGKWLSVQWGAGQHESKFITSKWNTFKALKLNNITFVKQRFFGNTESMAPHQFRLIFHFGFYIMMWLVAVHCSGNIDGVVWKEFLSVMNPQKEHLKRLFHFTMLS